SNCATWCRPGVARTSRPCPDRTNVREAKVPALATPAVKVPLSDTPRPHTPRRLKSCNRGMEMYSKDGRIRRQDVSEVKAYSAAREVMLKAEKHPVVKAYLKALKFVEEQQKCAKAEDCPSMFRNANVVPAACREPDETIQYLEHETARDGM